jgi:hypothetical protein
MTENGPSEPATENASVGGIVSTRVANVQVVHVRRPGRKRGGVSHEALRMRLTLERWTVEGRYLTTTRVRVPGSIEPRARYLYWQAVVPMPALQNVRAYWARQGRTGRRKGRKARTLIRAAVALHQWRAPVNRYTLGATMAVLDVRLSHRWIQATLKRAGWRTLRPYEYPKDAPGYAIANWVPRSK